MLALIKHKRQSSLWEDTKKKEEKQLIEYVKDLYANKV
jgi:hypothetical protein